MYSPCGARSFFLSEVDENQYCAYKNASRLSTLKKREYIIYLLAADMEKFMTCHLQTSMRN